MRKNIDFLKLLGLAMLVSFSVSTLAGEVISTDGYVVGTNTAVQHFSLSTPLTSDFSARFEVYTKGDSVNCAIDFCSSTSISPFGSNSRVGIKYGEFGVYSKGDDTGLGGSSSTGTSTGVYKTIGYTSKGENEEDTVVVLYTHYFADSTYSIAYVKGEDTITIAYHMGARKGGDGEPRDGVAYDGTGYNFVGIITDGSCIDSAGFKVEILDEIIDIEQGRIPVQTDDFSFKVTMTPGETTNSMFGLYSDGSGTWSAPVNVFFQPDDTVFRSKVTNFIQGDYKVAQNLYHFADNTPVNFIGTVKMSDSTFSLAVLDGSDTIFIVDNEKMRSKGITSLAQFEKIGTMDNEDQVFFEGFEILDEVIDLTETEVLELANNRIAYNIPIATQKGTFGASLIVVPERTDSTSVAVTFSDDPVIEWSGSSPGTNALDVKVTMSSYIKVQKEGNVEVDYLDTVYTVAGKPVKIYFKIDVPNNQFDIAASVDGGDIVDIAKDVTFRNADNYQIDSIAYRCFMVEGSDSKVGKYIQSEFELIETVIPTIINTEIGALKQDSITGVGDTVTVSQLLAALTTVYTTSSEVLDSSGGTAVAGTALVTDGMVVSLSNAEDTVEYKIGVVYIPSSEAEIISTTIGTLDKTNKVITNVPAETTVKQLLDALTYSDSASVDIAGAADDAVVTNDMKVTVTAEAGNTNDYDITLKVGINTTTLSVKTYPNPVVDVLYVEGAAISHVSVYDITGSLVKTVNNINNVINLTDIETGLYIAKFYNGSELVGVNRVVKK